jgi:hypothetical protein
LLHSPDAQRVQSLNSVKASLSEYVPALQFAQPSVSVVGATLMPAPNFPRPHDLQTLDPGASA